VNVWLAGPKSIPGTNYPSGGAIFRTIDLWKAAATAIDAIAPDLYTDDADRFRDVLSVYHRPDNPTWIPETNAGDACARYFFYALADGTIGYSPFGVDKTGWILPPTITPKFLAADYALIGPMDRELARLNFEGKVRTAVELPGHPTTTIDWGKWKADIYYGMPLHGNGEAHGSEDSRGRVIIAQLGPDEFLVAGIGVRVKFHLADNTGGRHMQYLRVQNGRYQQGKWTVLNWWNGDQTDFGLNFDSSGEVVHALLGTY
jgi:Domain of unknown function (DUF5597)